MRIMAIDYGDAHTGIAISDATGTLAGFSTVINSRRPEVVAQEIAALIPQHGVGELVLGYPKNMDGTLGPRAEKAARVPTVWNTRLQTPRARSSGAAISLTLPKLEAVVSLSMLEMAALEISPMVRSTLDSAGFLP